MLISQRNLLFLLFFISGFSGLIYESIWTHYLKLFLGHAAYAQTLVLTLFMGGMAIGAWLCSWLSQRWRNLLVMYALAEGLIGVAALVFHSLFIQATDTAFTSIIPALNGPGLIHLFKWALAGSLVLPQSILLGMTFPLMSGGVIRLFPSKRGGSIAMLYFTNSLGGAVGVLVSGFVTIKWIGLDGTIAAAGIVNILLAVVVWLLFRDRKVAPNHSPSHPPSHPIIKTRSPIVIQGYRLMLGVAFLTGTASFIYEISWIRMLSLVLGSSTHAFELMLSAFILGLACGGLWIYRKIDRLEQPIPFLAAVQIIMGMAALSTLALYGQTFNIMQWILSILEHDESGYLSFNLVSHALSMLIMFPTAFCAGMTLPLITYSLLERGIGERAIGAVYGVNTLGAIVGIAFAIHIGLPFLGLKGALITGASIDIALGLYLCLFNWSTLPRWLRLCAFPTGIGAIAVVMLFVNLSPHKMASGVYRSGSLLSDDSRVLDHQDGKTATISLTANADDIYFIRTNGKVDASIMMKKGGMPQFDEVTMTLIGAIPLLLRPDARQVANIGFGSGMTSHVVLANPRIEQLDSIEIEPSMVSVAKAMQPRNARVFTDPRSQIHYEDAKTFFSANQKNYDLIISEPSNPWVSGVAGLFSSQFYRNIKRHLNDQGILAQWLQIYEFDLELLFSILKAIDSQFNQYVIYALDQGDLLILASDGEINGFPIDQPFSIPELVPELKRIGVQYPEDLRLRWVGDKQFLTPLMMQSSVPINSDYFPYVDQFAAKARFMGADANEIFFPVKSRLPIRNILGRREISSDTTKVSASPLALVAQPIIEATYLYSQMVGQTVASNKHFSKLRQPLSSMDKIIDQCRTIPPHGDKVYLMYKIAVSTLSYLNPNEHQILWQAVEKLACGQNHNRYESLWLELFKASGRRDFSIMQQLSVRLLEQPQYLTDTRAKFLMGIGMLSLLAEEKKPEARFFWERFSKVWIKDTPTLQFKYLKAAANIPNHSQ